MAGAGDLNSKETCASLLDWKEQNSVIEEIDSNSSNYQHLQFDTMLKMVDSTSLPTGELVETSTLKEQRETEDVIKDIYDEMLSTGDMPSLNRSTHINSFLLHSLGRLPPMFKSLYASQPWMIYWSSNSLAVLGHPFPQELRTQSSEKIYSFLDPRNNGSFGGGLNQAGHLAATYASLLTLAIYDDEKTIRELDKQNFYNWLLSLKQPDGSFAMYANGEIDTRATYCALVIASLLNILTPELVENTDQWLLSCQTFEGGFGGVPYDEAHGGYTFCAIAGLMLLGKDLKAFINFDKFVRWTCFKQMSLEGGFCGRTNKLVDGCYSFWVGALVPILDIYLGTTEIVSRSALQNYILGCCQFPKGGLRDKPGKPPDGYHTNYVLLGLSIVQNKFYLAEYAPNSGIDAQCYSIKSKEISADCVQVNESDKVSKINPVFGLPEGSAKKFRSYFV